MYTEQLEELDRLTVNYIMTCVGAIGVVAGIIVTLRINLKDDEQRGKGLYRATSVLFMMIPAILCCFLSVEIFNMRKVSMYRAYLIYLEEEYNKLDVIVKQSFNTEVLGFLSKWTPQNTNGSAMNAVIGYIAGALILVVISISIFYSIRSGKKGNLFSRKNGKLPIILCYGALGFCVVTVVGLAIIDLFINDVSFDRVLNLLRN